MSTKRSAISRRGLEELQTLIRRAGLPLTIQRRAILKILLERDDHPTTDQLFEQVKTRIPGVSRTTVYRVLKTFVRLGIARRISHPRAAERFDPNIGHHHHLLCLRCNKLIDFDDPALDQLRLPNASRINFEIVDYSTYVEGYCSECRPKKTRRKNQPRRESLRIRKR